MLELINSQPWILALAIFLARLADVSLGTVRTIVVFRGFKFLAAVIGFVEILINDVKQAHLGAVDTPVHVPFLGGWRVRGKRK